ncbi:Very short patch repair protein [compost metagenome]
MVDIVNRAVRSRMMAAIHGQNTLPEIIVRKFLHRNGFRYQLHVRSLPGSPDLVLPKYELAIFVHGCFWHRHAGCRYTTTPDQNNEKWQRKFAQNIERDKRNIFQLRERGWRVMVIWECGLRTTQQRADLSSLPRLIMNKEISLSEWPPTISETD